MVLEKGSADIESLTIDDVCERCFKYLTDVDAVVFVLRLGIRKKEMADKAAEARKKPSAAVS